MAVLEWLKKNSQVESALVWQAAARFGYLNVLRWIHADGYSNFTAITIIMAARSGSSDVVKWLRENGCPWNVATTESAACSGNVELLEWLVTNGCPIDYDRCAYFASETGSLEILQWLDRNGYKITPPLPAINASHGHLEVLQWMKEVVCEWDEQQICAAAARGGQWEVIKWAMEGGCMPDEKCCEQAVNGGHFELLQWLRNNGCPWDKRTSRAAAQKSFEIFRWVVEGGCEVDEGICSVALSSGREENALWARSRGMKWTPEDERVFTVLIGAVSSKVSRRDGKTKQKQR